MDMFKFSHGNSCGGSIRIPVRFHGAIGCRCGEQLRIEADGWKVKVNDREVEAERIQGMKTAIQKQAREHAIRLLVVINKLEIQGEVCHDARDAVEGLLDIYQNGVNEDNKAWLKLLN